MLKKENWAVFQNGGGVSQLTDGSWVYWAVAATAAATAAVVAVAAAVAVAVEEAEAVLGTAGGGLAAGEALTFGANFLFFVVGSMDR